MTDVVRHCAMCSEHWIESANRGLSAEAQQSQNVRYEITLHSLGLVETLFFCSMACIEKKISGKE